MAAPVQVSRVEWNGDDSATQALNIGTAANRAVVFKAQHEGNFAGAAQHNNPGTAEIKIGALTIPFHFSASPVALNMHIERYVLAGAGLNALTGSQTFTVSGDRLNWKFIAECYSGVNQTTPNGATAKDESIAVDATISLTIDVAVDDLLDMTVSNDNGSARHTFTNGLTERFAGNVGGSPATWITVGTKAITSAVTGDTFTANVTLSESTKVGMAAVLKGVVANAPPVLASIGAKAVNQNSLLSFQISATDDADTPTLTSPDLPAGATLVDNANGTADFEWTPATGGVTNITFVATDSLSATDSEVVAVTVNALPVLAAIGAKNVTVDTLLSFQISATDAEDTPSFSSPDKPAAMSLVDNANGTADISWTPDTTGVFNVTFVATDSLSATDSEVVAITVNAAATAGVGVHINNPLSVSIGPPADNYGIRIKE